MQVRIIASALAVTMAAVGCTTMDGMSERQKGTAQGAAIGAAAGAVLGAVTAGGHKGKSAATGAVVGAVAGGVIGNVWSKRMEDQKRAMEQATQGTGVQVMQTADNQLKLNIPSDISFAVGKADIQHNFRPVLDQFAQSLNANPVTTVRIVGHTDSTGSDTTNNPLSVARANSTRDYLVGHGVAANRFNTEGMGERQPIATNDTVEGRAKNRRVEIFVAEPQQAPQPAK